MASSGVCTCLDLLRSAWRIFTIMPNVTPCSESIRLYVHSVLLLLSLWLYKGFVWLINGLMHLGASSFGIYLFHMFVSRFYRKFDFSGIPWLYHISRAWWFSLRAAHFLDCSDNSEQIFSLLHGRSSTKSETVPCKYDRSPYNSKRLTEKSGSLIF